jgi:gluconolactonase
MKKLLFLFLFIFLLDCTKKEVVQETPKIIQGFSTPESVAISPDGKYYVSNIGGFDVDGDGTISLIDVDSAREIVSGLNDPKGMAFWESTLFVSDKTKIWKITPDGNKTVFVDSDAFPKPPIFLNDLVFDKEGNLYVSDTGGFEEVDGAIFKVTPEGSVSTLVDYTVSEDIESPNGLIFNPEGNLLVVDLGNGKLMSISDDGENVTVLHEGFGAGDGLAYECEGNLYVSDWNSGNIHQINKEGNVSLFMEGFKASADITIDKTNHVLLVPEFNANRVVIVKLK